MDFFGCDYFFWFVVVWLFYFVLDGFDFDGVYVWFDGFSWIGVGVDFCLFCLWYWFFDVVFL